MPTSAPLPESFSKDPALVPLVVASSPIGRRVPEHLGFFLKEGRLFGTDGLNSMPVNIALLSYFAPLLGEGLAKIGRGGSLFLLSEDDFGRRMLVTDHSKLKSTILGFKEAIPFLLSCNFRTDESPAYP